MRDDPLSGAAARSRQEASPRSSAAGAGRSLRSVAPMDASRLAPATVESEPGEPVDGLAAGGSEE